MHVFFVPAVPPCSEGRLRRASFDGSYSNIIATVQCVVAAHFWAAQARQNQIPFGRWSGLTYITSICLHMARDESTRFYEW